MTRWLLQEQLDRERLFPRTVFPKIDPERLKPHVEVVDADVDRGVQCNGNNKIFIVLTDNRVEHVLVVTGFIEL